MKLLAIDTSGHALSAAIIENDMIIGSFGADTGKNHSLELLPKLELLFDDKDLSLSDMDAFAVTIGPGSFTGLRIGLATVKAWSQAFTKPLIGISSMDAMAKTAADNGYVVPIFDARRNEVYSALYFDERRLCPDRAIDPEVLAQELVKIKASIVFCGDGLKFSAKIFQKALGENFVLPKHGNTLFMAEAAAQLAYERYIAGVFDDSSSLVPIYLRLSEAEEKRVEAEKNESIRKKLSSANKR
jgi:tRNA threonylcarbamoyladenosine biosynthesis protein TsaB